MTFESCLSIRTKMNRLSHRFPYEAKSTNQAYLAQLRRIKRLAKYFSKSHYLTTSVPRQIARTRSLLFLDHLNRLNHPLI
jgi:hypothetical protein